MRNFLNTSRDSRQEWESSSGITFASTGKSPCPTFADCGQAFAHRKVFYTSTKAPWTCSIPSPHNAGERRDLSNPLLSIDHFPQ